MFKRKLRKSIASILTGATVLLTVNAFALVPTVAQAAAGDLVKSPDSGTVNVILADSESICSLTSEGHYDMWAQYKAKGVGRWQDVSTVDTSTYTDSGICSLRVGSLVRTAADPEVFVIQSGNTKRGFDAWDTFVADGYGSGGVYFVTDAALAGYTTGTKITSATTAAEIREGQLVKYASSATVYYVAKEDSALVKREVTNEDAYFSNFGINWNLVITVPDTETYTASDSQITGADTAINRPVAITTPTTPVTGGLTVGLASDSPDSTTYMTAGSDNCLMLKAIVTAGEADATVTGLQLKRSGLGASSDFGHVWLVVDGMRRGSRKSISSADEASLLFSTDNQKVAIKTGEMKTFEIWASVDALAASGDINVLSITGLTTTAATITGLPLAGNSISVTIAGPDVTYDDISVGTTVNIGDTSAELAKIKIRNDEANEDVYVESIVLKSASPAAGTRVDSDDVANFTLYDNDSVKVAGPVSMGADNYLRFNLNAPYKIDKGGSKYEIFTVKGDVMDGPAKIITLDVEYDSDIKAYGGSNSYYTDNADSFGSTEITIGNAALSVNVDTAKNPLTRSMIDDQDGIVLLAGNFRADQGAVSVTGMRVTLEGNDLDFGTTDEYENLRVYINGTLTSDATGSAISASDDATSINVNFTDEFNVTGTVPFEVKIDANSTVGANDWIRATVPGGNATATRDSDGAGITPTGTATGNKVTFASSAITVTASGAAPSLTRVKGSSDVVFAAFDVVVGTSSDVTLKSIKLNYDATDGSTDQAANQNDIYDIELLDSAQAVWVGGTSAKDLDSSNQVNFTGLNKAISAGGTMRFYVRGDINATINDADITTLYLEIIEVTADDVNSTAIDVTDDGSTTISATNEVNDDGATTAITVSDRGTLSIELSASTPKTKMAVTGSTGVTATELKLRALNENVSVTKLYITPVAGTANADELGNIYLYVGGNKVATTTLANGVAKFSHATALFTVESGATATLQIKADILTSDNSTADSGATIQFSINDFNADLEAKGTSQTVYPYVYKYNGTGVTLTDGAATTLGAAIGSTTATSITVASATGIDVGNLLLVDSEYMLVLATSGTTVTVVRGAANSTAATHSNGATITEKDMKLKSNTILTYANYPILSLPTQPTGELRVGTWNAFSFTVTPITGKEEDLRLEELKIRVDGSNMTASSSTGWYISEAYLYNGNNQVGSTVTTDVITSGDITFSSLDSDDDGIVSSAITFTVKLLVAEGSTGIVEGNTLQLSIDDFGSANAAGAITAGDFDWIDMESASSVIEWVDTTETSLSGTTFIKS